MEVGVREGAPGSLWIHQSEEAVSCSRAAPTVTPATLQKMTDLPDRDSADGSCFCWVLAKFEWYGTWPDWWERFYTDVGQQLGSRVGKERLGDDWLGDLLLRFLLSFLPPLLELQVLVPFPPFLCFSTFLFFLAYSSLSYCPFHNNRQLPFLLFHPILLLFLPSFILISLLLSAPVSAFHKSLYWHKVHGHIIHLYSIYFWTILLSLILNMTFVCKMKDNAPSSI